MLNSRLQNPYTEASLPISFVSSRDILWTYKHINAYIPHTLFYPQMMAYCIVLHLTFFPSLGKRFILKHIDLL